MRWMHSRHRAIPLLAAAAIIAAGPAPGAAQEATALDTLHAAAASRLEFAGAAAARSVDVLERADIEALPATSVLDVLARALGVDLLARSAAQADVAIRGGTFEQVLVMIDGVPVNDDQTGHFHMSTGVPLDAIERIEVLRGPASAVYGSAAVGGVINIVTRRGAEGLNVRAQAGSFGGMAGELGGSFEAGSAALGISAAHDRSDGYREGTDHRASTALVTLDGEVGGGAARLDLSYAARDFGADAFYAQYDSWEETRTATAAASWRGEVGRWLLAPRLSLRRNDDDFILVRADPAFYHNMHVSRRAAAELVARRSLSPRTHLAIGVEGALSDLDSNSLGEREEDRAAAFGELSIGAADAALSTAGIRIDRHSTFGSFLSSSVAGSYPISTALRLRASGATGFRAPNWTERYYEDPGNIGNPDLEVERFWTAEMGARLQLGSVTADLSTFIRHARDLIDWARPLGEPETAPYRIMNVTSAHFRGAEALLRTDIGSAEVTARAAVLDFTAEAEGFNSKYALRPLTQSFSIEAALPLPAGTTLNVRGASHDRPRAQAWRVLDVRLSGSVRGAQLFADVTNLFGATWLDVSDREGPGRGFSVGLRLRR